MTVNKSPRERCKLKHTFDQLLTQTFVLIKFYEIVWGFLGMTIDVGVEAEAVEAAEEVEAVWAPEAVDLRTVLRKEAAGSAEAAGAVTPAAGAADGAEAEADATAATTSVVESSKTTNRAALCVKYAGTPSHSLHSKRTSTCRIPTFRGAPWLRWKPTAASIR